MLTAGVKRIIIDSSNKKQEMDHPVTITALNNAAGDPCAKT